MMVKIPCDEKFILQYFRDLTNSGHLIKALTLLVESKFKEYNKVIVENIDRDDYAYNILLLESFLSRAGESEIAFLDRYHNTIFFTAEEGNPISQFAVAEYFEDKGELSKAFTYYQLSSEKEFAPSLTNAGIKLIYGVGCTTDINRGLSLLRKSKQLGDEIAKEFLNYYTEA